jgi:effector-binding domain-containing protein
MKLYGFPGTSPEGEGTPGLWIREARKRFLTKETIPPTIEQMFYTNSHRMPVFMEFHTASMPSEGRALMNQNCERTTRELSPSAVIRTRCSVKDLPNVIGPIYQSIGGYFQANGILPAGPPYVGYHNDDMQDLDLEIGFPVMEPIEGQDEIVPSSIPAGEFASTMHIGPYHEIEQAYTRLSAWIEAQSFQPAGQCYEIYLNDPADTPQDALQTLILFPLV